MPVFHFANIRHWLTPMASQEDINAQFGDRVAIHYYGATDAEKEEMERAAQEDEEAELKKTRGSVSENEKIAGAVQQQEIVTEKSV